MLPRSPSWNKVDLLLKKGEGKMGRGETAGKGREGGEKERQGKAGKLSIPILVCFRLRCKQYYTVRQKKTAPFYFCNNFDRTRNIKV